MKNKLSRILFILTPIVLISALIICFINNDIYNKTLRVGNLTAENYKDGEFCFEEIGVRIMVRGGDSGAWLKDPILDDEGNEIHGASVGTIYEAVISNKTKDIVSDWTLKIPINEMMWINNSWNSKMEIHQNVNQDEKVLTINLNNYSQYDINLDYYIDHTGPMIPLYVGDYFIYLPEEGSLEKPIKPAKTEEIWDGSAGFGYIMYIPDKKIDYVADFSGGEINYYMYANPLSKSWFWMITILLFVWCVWAIILLIVYIKTKKVLEQQRIQKEHDEEMVRQTMQIIINMIENKDTSTMGHSLRVAEYSKLIAEKMNYSEDECKNVYYIGLMHDCGKVNIPDSILKNPGKLTQEEYEIMKKHTIYGGEILKDFTSIKNIDIGAKYHHERYDGKGYPTGLKGEDIPVIARIIGIADAFDAMNSKRCYRDRLPKEIILSELENNRGKQFDSNILNYFLQLIEEGKIELS